MSQVSFRVRPPTARLNQKLEMEAEEDKAVSSELSKSPPSAAQAAVSGFTFHLTADVKGRQPVICPAATTAVAVTSAILPMLLLFVNMATANNDHH